MEGGKLNLDTNSPTTSDLATLAKQINDGHDACGQAERYRIEHVVRNGNLLIRAKELCEHGSWTAWVTENCDPSMTTCQLYMRMAREVPKLDEAKTQRVVDLSLRELDKFIRRETKPHVEIVEDDVPEAPETAITRPGDIWHLGDHRVLCGDATVAGDVLRVTGGQSVQLVSADPPYGVAYTGGGKEWDAFRNDPKDPVAYGAFVRDLLKNGHTVATEDAALYLWFSDSQMGAIDYAVRDSGWFKRCLVLWIKDRFTFSRLPMHYRQQHEPCVYAGASKQAPAWFGPTNETTTWNIVKAQSHEHHPTQKPVTLYARMLKNSTEEGDSLLDLCLGSGTTLIACEQLGRTCYGVEIEPKYCDVAAKRWEALTGKTAERVAGARVREVA